MASENAARDFAFVSWWADSSETTLGTQQEGEAFNAGWRAAQAHLRTQALLTASPHESCSEMTRNALEAATDPSERTLVLTLDEIKALTAACAWIIYPDSRRYYHLHALVDSAEAKLEAAQAKETQ